MINVGTAMGYLDLDTSKFEMGLASALKNLKGFSKESESTNDALKLLGGGMSTLGSTMTKSFTIPIVAAGTAATGFASNFETSLSKVKAISGATADEMELLKDKALDMGAQTKFSASEAADAMQYMAMAGWDAEAMLDGISGIMNLAAADGLDLATTSDIVTDALTAFGLEAKDSADFADVLAKASAAANTNVSMLGESFKYIAPVAGSLGYDYRDVAVALGIMANNGIKASQAGTTLRAAMTRMVKPTDAAANIMDKYSISLTNADGSMKTYAQVMDNLRGSLGNLSEAEQAKAAATLFGQEAMSGMLALINTSEAEYNKLADAIYKSQGAAQDMSATMMDNLSGSIEQMMGALETLAIKIGDVLSPIIRGVVDNITAFIDKLSEMSEEEIKSIVNILAVVAAIGPLLSIFGKLMTSIAGINLGFKAIGEFAKVIGPVFTGISGSVLGVIAVIGVLVAAFVSLWNNSEEFRNTITSIIEEVKTKFEEFGTAIKERLNALGIDFQGFGDLVLSIWNGFTSVLAPIFEGAFQAVSDIVTFALDMIIALFDIFVGLFTGNTEQFWSGIGKIFSTALQGIFNFFKNIVDTILKVLSNFLAIFGNDWKGSWDWVVQIFTDIWNDLVKFFEEKILTIPEKVKEIKDDVVQAGKDMMNGLLDGIKSIGQGIVDWFTDTFGWIGQLIEGAKQGLSSIMSSTASIRVAGTHANGLEYVPYDGYIASLHKGEKVLTKNEAESYNNEGSGNKYDITFVTPKAIDEAEAERRFREVIRKMNEGFEV